MKLFPLALALSGCALFTSVVSVLTPASAALVTCLDDYVDATPANPLKILSASIACGVTVAAVIPVLEADLAAPADAGSDAVTPIQTQVAIHAERRAKLAALYADAKAGGYVK